MVEFLLVVLVVLAVACVVLLIVLWRRGAGDFGPLQARLEVIERGQDKGVQAVRDELSRGRSEATESARQLREEVINSVKSILDSVVKSIGEAGQQQAQKLDGFVSHLSKTNEVSQDNGRLLREDVTKSIQGFSEAALSQVKESAEGQKERLDAFSQRLELMAFGIDTRLKEGQATNDIQIKEMRLEVVENARKVKEETITALGGFKEAVVQRLDASSGSQKEQLEAFAIRLAGLAQTTEQRLDLLREAIDKRLTTIQEANDKRLGEMRDEGRTATQAMRSEITTALRGFQEIVQKQMTETAGSQRNQLADFLTRLNGIAESNDKKMEALRGVVDQRLKDLQEDNTKKLDQMRQTVDEKLEGTLTARLGESFKLVSERLELVHKGLGEMQTLALGVGDLKKVLTNVKTRGTWGEVQLGNLLEQILTPEQFERNVATKSGSEDRVEFAIKLPGRSGEQDRQVWLPIDSKCPQEDYLRLVEAAERADAEGVREAVKQLDLRIRACAKTISEKYVSPPDTTDFGILFVPTEGLFAEIIRCPGLTEALQQNYRIMIAGPTTLAAMLNSLQMGFRTLAIEKRSSEVWNVLSAVKSEFGKFGAVFDKVKKKLAEATNTVESASVRTRAMNRKLRTVENLPAPDAAGLLGLLPVEAPAVALDDEGQAAQ